VARNSAAAGMPRRSAEQPPRRLRAVDGDEQSASHHDASSHADDARSGRAGKKAVIPPELDRLIHERMRLGIVSALAVNESLSFTEIKDLMRTTDGNLSVHARKLEEAKYISCSKSFEGRVPHTVYKLTSMGRRALERYLDHMESIIRVTRER
jgi:DNA-binding transcriptional ArsR family regulator